MMTRIWVFMIGAAALTGILAGRTAEVSAAVAQGASGAVQLIISITGMMCLWSGVMNVLSESGLAERIAALMRPVLKILFKQAAGDSEALMLISANITANLLGLSNAATPVGLKAAERLYKISGGKRASDELITFIVLNTASLQLIPTTIAAVRAAHGASRPYDIIPAVWLASAVSVLSGLSAAFILRAFANNRKAKTDRRLNTEEEYRYEIY